MISKEAAETFFSGAFGKIYTRDFVDNLYAMVARTSAKNGDVTATFDQGAKPGDTIIKVTLTLETLEEKEDDE